MHEDELISTQFPEVQTVGATILELMLLFNQDQSEDRCDLKP